MKLFQRVWDSIGFNDQYDEAGYEYEYEEEASPNLYPPEAAYSGNKPPQPATNNNVVGLPSRNATQEIVLLEPRSFEEMPQAVTALRERKSVVLNLALIDPDLAQRCVDFVAGGAFAIDGHQERLGENIFLFTPNFVQISNYPKQQVYQSPASASYATAPTQNWAEQSRIAQ